MEWGSHSWSDTSTIYFFCSRIVYLYFPLKSLIKFSIFDIIKKRKKKEKRIEYKWKGDPIPGLMLLRFTLSVLINYSTNLRMEYNFFKLGCNYSNLPERSDVGNLSYFFLTSLSACI